MSILMQYIPNGISLPFPSVSVYLSTGMSTAFFLNEKVKVMVPSLEVLLGLMKSTIPQPNL